MSSVLLAYPDSGYPVEVYNGKPIYEYFAKRVNLISRVLHEQNNLKSDVCLIHLEKLNTLKSYQCIIPFMVNLPKALSTLKAANALYIQDPEIYEELDLKSKMCGFEFVNENTIPQIPTLDLQKACRVDICDFVAANNFNEFMLKPEDSAGSLDQLILERSNVEKMCEFLGKAIVIQPFVKDHDVFAINALMIDGEVVAHFGSINVGGLLIDKPPVDYIFNENVSNDHWRAMYAIILDFTKRFSKKHNVGGIIEIEFLQPKGTQKLFLLEVNPRISGWCESFVGTKIPFIDILMVPYMQHFGIDVEPAHQYDLSKPLAVYHPADEGKDATDYFDSIAKKEFQTL